MGKRHTYIATLALNNNRRGYISFEADDMQFARHHAQHLMLGEGKVLLVEKDDDVDPKRMGMIRFSKGSLYPPEPQAGPCIHGFDLNRNSDRKTSSPVCPYCEDPNDLAKRVLAAAESSGQLDTLDAEGLAIEVFSLVQLRDALIARLDDMGLDERGAHTRYNAIFEDERICRVDYRKLNGARLAQFYRLAERCANKVM